MSHTEGIVHSQNNHFISFTKEVNATHITEYMLPRIKRKEFKPGTHFILVAGTHHGKVQGKVELGSTDFVLLQGFYHKLFTVLLECSDEETGESIWEQMDYSRELIPISAIENLDIETFESTYELSRLSQNDLTCLAKRLRESTTPNVIIFASCYSFESEVRELLIANGILASMNIAKDRAEVSEGRVFALNDQQKEIIDLVVKVRKILSLIFVRLLETCFLIEISG